VDHGQQIERVVLPSAVCRLPIGGYIVSWHIVHVTYESSEEEKRKVLRLFGLWGDDNPLWLRAVRSRLEAPWADEVYGLAAAFMGDRCVGTTAYTISGRGQGILSGVFTDPEFRRRGIGAATLQEAVGAFRRHGARAVYLAAWVEWVRSMYRKVGFVCVGTMGERHAFKLTLDPSGENEHLFRSGQRTRIRPMAIGDQADLSALFNAQRPCVVKHYELGCFLGSHFEPEFYTLRADADRAGFRAIVLDGEETVLGFGTVLPSPRRHQGHTGVLDLLVHPNYARWADEMTRMLEMDCGLERLSVYLEDSEADKRQTLERAGYRKIARFERRLKIGTEYYDLTMHQKNVAGY